MKCRECPDYAKCVKESNLAIKRKKCPKAKTEKPQTNADSIRAMNDEDLAKWLAHTMADTVWDSLGKKGVPFSRVCAVPEYYYQFLNWLKQPAEGDSL